jgi:hypothetical protein
MESGEARCDGSKKGYWNEEAVGEWADGIFMFVCTCVYGKVRLDRQELGDVIGG